MKRIAPFVRAALLIAVLVVSCGEDNAAQPTPQPADGAPGIVEPAGRARDTVDELNRQQQDREEQLPDY